MKYYITSDPHGFFTPLKKALEEKGYFSDPEPHKLIICGDLFDRGPEAVLMQDFVLEEIEKDRIILIRGNHEDLIQEYVERNCIADSNYINNGIEDTAMQLTGLSKGSEKMAEEMRKTPLLTQILPSMLNFYETKNYIFIHGWIPCVQNQFGYVKIPNWRTETFDEEWYFSRYINGMDAWKSIKEEGKTVVCGHWTASYGHSRYEGKENDFTPFCADGIIALDASTPYSGFVNCIVIED